MQSFKSKTMTPQRIGIAIAAIGTLTIALTGTGMIFDDADNGGGSAQPVVRSVQRTAPLYSDSFLEWNTNLPGVSDERTVSTTDSEPLEPNLTPPGSLRPAVISSDMMRFLEVNTILPEVPTTFPTVMSYEDSRFLEMNTMLPTSNDSYLPIPGGSRYEGGLLEY